MLLFFQNRSDPIRNPRRRAGSGQLSRVVQDACGTVWSTLRAQKLTGAGRHVAVYLDDQINLEVGVELDAPFAGCGEVIPSGTPPGPVATTTPPKSSPMSTICLMREMKRDRIQFSREMKQGRRRLFEDLK